MAEIKDSTEGRVFGKWTILQEVAVRERPVTWASGHRTERARFLLCRCQCGATLEVNRKNVLSGLSTNCGCVRRQKLSDKATHGEARPGRTTAEYKIWRGILARCYMPSASGFHRYGGRGIKVCDRWHDYANFLADMGRKPSPRHSVERENNDGDYEPDNCVWALPWVQALNKSNNHRITLDGVTLTITEWARLRGNTAQRIIARLNSGWPEADAIHTPSKRPRAGIAR